MATPLVILDGPEQGSRLFKLRILGGEKTLAPFGVAIGFKARDASGSVSRVESGERRLTDAKSRAAANYLAGRGDLVSDPRTLYHYLIGFPGVALRDCIVDDAGNDGIESSDSATNTGRSNGPDADSIAA